jgi:nicotinamidase-related amidase
VPGSTGASLIPELTGVGLNFVPKKHFSCFVDSAVDELLKSFQVQEVVIAGINTDYCIFLSSLDAFARCRVKTTIVEDAVGSVFGQKGHTDGLYRLRNHLPNGAVTTLDEFLVN